VASILLLFFRRAINTHNKLIDSQHYKRHRENNQRIPFTLTFHPHNHAVKSIILKNFKLLQNDPNTGRISSQPPLISFKRDKNIGNFLVRSVFQTSEQPGPVLLNALAHNAKHVLSFATLRKYRDPSDQSFHLYLSQCHLLHNLHSRRKVIHRRNRETTGRPIPRTFS